MLAVYIAGLVAILAWVALEVMAERSWNRKRRARARRNEDGRKDTMKA